MAVTTEEAKNLHYFMLHAQAAAMSAQSKALLAVAQDPTKAAEYANAGVTREMWTAQWLNMMVQVEVLQKAAVILLEDAVK